ncbi:MAG: hypothetical protein LBR82_01930 [Desulfovibrio sp.]|jgi:hypothetical protein|nr:hypothetical protein [Desulfovibrio sp.]
MPMYSGSNPYQRAMGAVTDTSASTGAVTETTQNVPINRWTEKSDLFKGATGLGLNRRDDGTGIATEYVPGYGQAAGIAHNPVAGVYGFFSQNQSAEEKKQALSGNDPRLSGGARALSIGNNFAMTGGLSLIGFL